jgi:shikimate dehydrogenase
MRGHPPLVADLTGMAPGSIVFDMVYDPLETDLLRQARACGLIAIDGLDMLVAQAAAAFELFFCEAAPRQHDAELRELLTA